MNSFDVFVIKGFTVGIYWGEELKGLHAPSWISEGYGFHVICRLHFVQEGRGKRLGKALLKGERKRIGQGTVMRKGIEVREGVGNDKRKAEIDRGRRRNRERGCEKGEMRGKGEGKGLGKMKEEG